MKKCQEELTVDDFEMEEILGNAALLKRLEEGHAQAVQEKGRFAEEAARKMRD